MYQMNIIKCRYDISNDKYAKICEFISAPTLLDLDKLAKYLNCVVYIADNKIYFFNAEVIEHKISIPPRLKDMEFACVILSYEKGE
jgi:hypothetical protein